MEDLLSDERCEDAGLTEGLLSNTFRFSWQHVRSVRVGVEFCCGPRPQLDQITQWIKEGSPSEDALILLRDA